MIGEWRTWTALGVSLAVGLVLAFVFPDSRSGAVREIGGALVVAASIGGLLYWMEQRREDARDAHDAVLAADQMRHSLAVAVAMRDDITNTILAGQDLRGIVLVGRDLSDANLQRSDLSGAQMYGIKAQNIDLSEANLAAADLARADLSGAHVGQSTLSETDLNGAKLIEVGGLDGVDLSETQLYDAVFDVETLCSLATRNRTARGFLESLGPKSHRRRYIDVVLTESQVGGLLDIGSPFGGARLQLGDVELLFVQATPFEIDPSDFPSMRSQGPYVALLQVLDIRWLT
ncbi:MAG: pentapeptide repeat-containing protein [Actinomycetota bacterium]